MEIQPSQSEEIEYFCPKCGVNFVVYHRNKDRNTHCCWCGAEVKQTGRIRKIEGDEIIEYQDGVEVGREPKRIP